MPKPLDKSIENLRKYYPNPDAIARSTWDIIERFWTLDYLTLKNLSVINTLNSASKHDSHGFLETFFRMKSFLPNFNITKLLLDSTHDAMPIYKYCKQKTSFLLLI